MTEFFYPSRGFFLYSPKAVAGTSEIPQHETCFLSVTLWGQTRINILTSSRRCDFAQIGLIFQVINLISQDSALPGNLVAWHFVNHSLFLCLEIFSPSFGEVSRAISSYHN